MSKFSPATVETRKPWSNIFKVLRENNFKFSLSFKSKGKIKTFFFLIRRDSENLSVIKPIWNNSSRKYSCKISNESRKKTSMLYKKKCWTERGPASFALLCTGFFSQSCECYLQDRFRMWSIFTTSIATKENIEKKILQSHVCENVSR